ncbi:hypothetical protein AB4Z54_59970, partial [Streptomyces sp. MCAF7]
VFPRGRELGGHSGLLLRRPDPQGERPAARRAQAGARPGHRERRIRQDHRGNDQLRDALKQALALVIANGEYDKIIAKWGVKEGAVDKAVVNGGK